jgi:hypothetical protein
LSTEEFNSLLVTFSQVLFEERVSQKRKRKIGGGAKGNFNIKSAPRKLFFILFYAKVYPTFDLAAFVFDSSKSCTHRWMHENLPRLEKSLGRKVLLPERRITTAEEFFEAFPDMKEVIIDGMERPTQRPSKNKTQRKHYSGKKKKHTRQNTVVTDKTKRILMLSPTKHGSIHDKKMTDKNMIPRAIPENVSIVVDTGFQGIQKLHPNVLIPKKKPRGGYLTEAEKEMNRLISSIRIVVEHAIGGMKRYGWMADIYRNKNGIDDTFANVTAGLWNLHIEMK